MNNFENAKSVLKGEIMQSVAEIQRLNEKINELLKEKEEIELISRELEEAVKKLSE